MSDPSTVHFKEPSGRTSSMKITGYIVKQDASGVWINDREDHRGTSTFWPMHNVSWIEFNTGW